METKSKITKRSPFMVVGLVGFLITTSMQAGMTFIAAVDGARNWAIWLPCYMVWVVFAVIGFVHGRRR